MKPISISNRLGLHETTGICHQAQYDCLQVGRIPVRIIDDGSLNGHQLGALEATLAPNTSETLPHLHRRYTVTFLVTQGTVEFKVAHGVYRASTGDYIAVPIGVPYTFSNPFDKTATFHLAFAPSGLIEYFRDLAELTKAGPLEWDAWVEVMAQHGIEPVNVDGSEVVHGFSPAESYPPVF